MLMIRDDCTRFNAVYLVLSKNEVSRYFRQYLADYRFTGVPCPVETVRTDDASAWLYILLCNRWLIQNGATAVVGKSFSDIGTTGVSFMLPNSTLLSSSYLFFSSSVFSGCNKDVVFSIRVSSLTEPGLYKHASDFWKL